MYITSDVKAMNKIMFFMMNCGYNEVRKLLYNTFDSYLADHIFSKYKEQIENTRMAFFNIYFEVDKNVRRRFANISQIIIMTNSNFINDCCL
jgi:hypothetical protein